MYTFATQHTDKVGGLTSASYNKKHRCDRRRRIVHIRALKMHPTHVDSSSSAKYEPRYVSLQVVVQNNKIKEIKEIKRQNHLRQFVNFRPAPFFFRRRRLSTHSHNQQFDIDNY